MATIPLQEPVYRGQSGPLLFAAGFRPFFLFAALQAFGMLPLWLAVYAGLVDLRLPFATPIWHAHEMVFGFAGAAIGGFLLTAVPNWTNTRPLRGGLLCLLFVCWLLGRVAFTLAGWLPPWVVAVIDASYLPLLAVLLSRPLIAAGKGRNMMFLPLLGLLAVANALVLAGALWRQGDASLGIRLALAVVLTMVVMVGGRIIPSFTQNWLRLQGKPGTTNTIAWIEKGGAAGSVLIAMLAAAWSPESPVTGAALLGTALVHLVRLNGWQGRLVLAAPILWVLHLGYLWLVLGLAIWGLSVFFPVVPTAVALHGLTAGCIGTMVMAVMSRASLGHTGRPLSVGWPVVVAYGLLSLGALLRLIAPLVPSIQMEVTQAGGGMWALAWGLFLIVYWPVLTRPRLDGRPD